MTTLFDGVPESDATIQAAFDRFHAANPQVFELFCRFAEDLRQAGIERYSSDAILHRIRWHINVEVKNVTSDFKINNNFSSRYARLLIARDATFAGFFDLRRLSRE